MKYLLAILLLTGCGEADLYNLIGKRRFAVGDCLIMGIKEPEEWERHDPKYVVDKLGKSAYLIRSIDYKTITDNVDYGHLWEDFYQKVDCK